MKATLNLFLLSSIFFLCRLMENRTVRTLKFENRSTIYLLVSRNNLCDVNLFLEELSKHFNYIKIVQHSVCYEHWRKVPGGSRYHDHTHPCLPTFKLPSYKSGHDKRRYLLRYLLSYLLVTGNKRPACFSTDWPCPMGQQMDTSLDLPTLHRMRRGMLAAVEFSLEGDVYSKCCQK